MSSNGGVTAYLIIDSLKLGGAERVALAFAAEPAHATALIALQPPPAGAPALPLEASQGRSPVTLDLRSLTDWRQWLRLLRHLSGELAAGRRRGAGAALLHTHLRYATVWGGAAARRLGVPHIVTLHSLPGEERGWRQRLAAALERRAWRRADRVIYVSHAQAAAWRARRGAPDPARCRVVPNGVVAPVVSAPRAELRARHAIPAGAFVCLTVAVVRERKGWPIWLEAISRLASAQPDALFLWAGGGPDGERLGAAVAAHPHRDRIRLLGPRTDIGDWLTLSDLFLFPSLEEALPTAVLEAMAAGLPVIASDLPAVAEILGDAGTRVPAGDAAALADAVAAWSGEPGREGRRRAAARGGERVRQFSGDAWRRGLWNLYEEVLAERSGGAGRGPAAEAGLEAEPPERAARNGAVRAVRAPAGPPRILLVEFFAHGGLLHYSWQLSAALAHARPGAEVMLLTGRHPEFPGAPDGVRLLPELFTWNPHFQVPRRLRPLARAWRAFRYFAAWLQILARARRLRPDVILFGDLEHRGDAWAIGRLRRGPATLAAIWHNVDAFERTRPGRLVRRAPWRDRLVRQFDVVFVHGHALARQLHSRTGLTAHVIPHGHQQGLQPASRAAGAAVAGDTRPLALLFGSLTQYKGIPVLLEALALLPPTERPAILIAGLPTADLDLAGLRRLAAQRGLDADITWDARYIPTPDLDRYFGPADFVVLPYLAASQSGVAHWALTYAKPLIVTRTGSLPELIDGNGRVVPPADPSALAAALRELTLDAALRRRMGERSAQLATRDHDWGLVADRIWTAFDAAAVTHESSAA